MPLRFQQGMPHILVHTPVDRSPSQMLDLQATGALTLRDLSLSPGKARRPLPRTRLFSHWMALVLLPLEAPLRWGAHGGLAQLTLGDRSRILTPPSVGQRNSGLRGMPFVSHVLLGSLCRDIVDEFLSNKCYSRLL